MGAINKWWFDLSISIKNVYVRTSQIESRENREKKGERVVTKVKDGNQAIKINEIGLTIRSPRPDIRAVEKTRNGARLDRAQLALPS